MGRPTLARDDSIFSTPNGVLGGVTAAGPRGASELGACAAAGSSPNRLASTVLAGHCLHDGGEMPEPSRCRPKAGLPAASTSSCSVGGAHKPRSGAPEEAEELGVQHYAEAAERCAARTRVQAARGGAVIGTTSSRAQGGDSLRSRERERIAGTSHSIVDDENGG